MMSIPDPTNVPCPLCGGPTRFVLDVDPEGDDPRPEVSGWAQLIYCEACVQLWALTPVSTLQVDSRHARALAREVLRLQAALVRPSLQDTVPGS